MCGAQRCSWVGRWLGLEPSPGSRACLAPGLKAPRRGWNSICFSTGSLGPQFQGCQPSHTGPPGCRGACPGKGTAGVALWPRRPRSITLTALLAAAVTEACWGSRGGGRGLHPLVGDPHGSGRACLEKTTSHAQKPRRGTCARERLSF